MRRRRTGGTYVLVIGTAMIISLLGITTVALQRLQLRQIRSLDATLRAQQNAESGLAMAMLRIQQDADWRDNLAHGEWFTVDTGQGQVTLSGYDDQDGDLADDATDPLRLEAAGSMDGATQRSRVVLWPSYQPLDCLQAGMVAGDRIVIDDATLDYRGTIAANNRINARSNSVVWPHALAVNSVSGSGYQQTQQVGVAPRQMPDVQALLSDYQSQATSINMATLPRRTPNLVKNPGFETDLAGWSAVDQADLQRSNAESVQGDFALRVTQRASGLDGAAYDFTPLAYSDTNYTARYWVRFDQFTFVRFRCYIRAGGQDYVRTSSWRLAFPMWMVINITFQSPEWEGPAERAELRLESSSASSFYLDEADLYRPAPSGMFTHGLVSGSHNSFGATNADGKYVIDCGGNELQISECRLVGTLIVRNASRVLLGPGPVCWTPTRPGQPTLLSDSPVVARMSQRGLSEHMINVNLNPPGMTSTEFPPNVTLTDSYPSSLGGILCTSESIEIQQPLNLFDARLIADDDIHVDADVRQTATESALVAPPPGLGETVFQRQASP